MSVMNDFNGFNCNIIPYDWNDYLIQYNNEKKRYTSCVIETYYNNLNNYMNENNLDEVTALNDPCYVSIVDMFNSFTTLSLTVDTKMTDLINALALATPNDPTTFDSTIYYDYIDVYTQWINLSKELNLALTTGCKVVAIENNVGVDLKTLGTKTIQHCEGVYIKQIDNGSEFIGKITSSSNLTEK